MTTKPPWPQKNNSTLDKPHWGIADQLRGAMNADDFRDYMLSFLFLRYLSDNDEAAAGAAQRQRFASSEEEHYSRRVSMEKIFEKNDYNLNIPRNASTAVAKPALVEVAERGHGLLCRF